MPLTSDLRPPTSGSVDSSESGSYIPSTLLWGVPMNQSLVLHNVHARIFVLRGQKIMLDMHLAELYGVETKALKRAVKRNRDRFPGDFCFTLTDSEIEALRYHFGPSSWGGTRYKPYAFTEQGVAMLSSILKSKKAIHANIAIMSRRDGFAKSLCADARAYRDPQGVHQEAKRTGATDWCA